MRHLMISAAYALACLVSCLLAVFMAKGKQPDTSVSKIVEIEKEKVSKNKDNSSQSLTTYYPEPTKTIKISDH